jgi:large subunit ribosomal protein L9
MNILLSEDIPGLGDIGQTVKVKPGYARNFLIPRGLAVELGAASARGLEHKRRVIDKKRKELKSQAEAIAERLKAHTLVMGLRVGSGGRVFGSIRAKDISDALLADGYEIDRRRIHLDEPIKKTGEKKVSVKLHSEVKVTIRINVEQRAATEEEDKQEVEAAKFSIETKAAANNELTESELEDAGWDSDTATEK